MTSYGYNQAGALESETERRNSTLLQSYTYQYDNLGNREKLIAAGGKSYTVDYAYDKSNRLQTETRTQGSAVHMTDYYYDPNGNMISTMLSQFTPAAAGDKAALDIGNNLDDVAFYGYDGFNRQTSVQSGDTQASYAYLPNGLRASKTVDGVTTGFVWSGSQMILERGADGDVTYIRGINLIASRKGAESTYYLHNGHGDVTQLANASGAVTRSYDYDAFGVEQNPVDADANRFRYCGEYWDGETETYYLRARNYNPATGRFRSEDSVRGITNRMPNGQEIVDPLSLNLYTYTNSNPIRYIDPSGHIIKLSDDATEEQKQQYERAIEYLKTSPTAARIIELLMETDKVTITIVFVDDMTPSYDPDSRTIYWDPTGGAVLADGESVISPAVLLLHEMGHAKHHAQGKLNKYLAGGESKQQIEKMNLQDHENPVQKELGEFVRVKYGDASPYRVGSSTDWGTIKTIHPWYHYLWVGNWGSPSKVFENQNTWNPSGSGGAGGR